MLLSVVATGSCGTEQKAGVPRYSSQRFTVTILAALFENISLGFSMLSDQPDASSASAQPSHRLYVAL